MADKKDTRRRYPRAQAQLKAKLSIPGDKRAQFEATLRTLDIGVGGLFFESTFFLKLGMKVDVELDVPPHGRHVHCRGRIVRVETAENAGRKARNGFAVKFEEYFGQSEVILANYFLGPVLRDFLQRYAKEQKLQLPANEVDRLVDVLAAWEVHKTTVDDEQVWGSLP